MLLAGAGGRVGSLGYNVLIPFPQGDSMLEGNDSEAGKLLSVLVLLFCQMTVGQLISSP